MNTEACVNHDTGGAMSTSMVKWDRGHTACESCFSHLTDAHDAVNWLVRTVGLAVAGDSVSVMYQ